MSENSELNDEPLYFYGSEVKALGGGRVAGYLVRFADANNPDLEGEFFTRETDFDLPPDGIDHVSIYYHHGMDHTIKNRKLGGGTVSQKDDLGLWIEAQLNLIDDYERWIYEQAAAGKMGWSSTAISHLVQREKAVTGAYHIKAWPLGKDATITPQPAAGPGPTRVVTKQFFDATPQLADVAINAMPSESYVILSDGNIQEIEDKNIMSEPTEKSTGTDAVAEILARMEERLEAMETKAVDATKATPTNEVGVYAPTVITNTSDWKYDGVSVGQLALMDNVITNATKTISPERRRAIARRLEADETKGSGYLLARRELKAFTRGMKADETNFSTNASYGNDWVGSALGSEIWDSIRAGSQVIQKLEAAGSVFDFPAGSEALIIPLQGETVFYTVAQAGDPSSATARVTNTVPAKAMGTSSATLTLGKLGTSVIYTGEMIEDSMLPFLAELQRSLALNGAEYLSSAVIDGDTETGATTNINDIGGTPSANDHFMIFNGFRKSCLVTTTANSRDGGALASADFLATAALMGGSGINAIDRTKVSFLIDPATHYAALQLADVKTRDVFNGATIENGQLSSIYGYEVLVDGQMCKMSAVRLSNTAGKVDQDTTGNNTKGSILAVRWDQWKLGRRRNMTIEVMREPRADAWELTGMLRCGLIQRDTEASAISYNLTV